MIVSPTANLRAELIYQIGSRHAERGFDGLPDAVQEGFDILLGRLDYHVMAGIEMPSTATLAGRALHDQVRAESTGRRFPGVIITATYASRSRHTTWPL